jgi:hypothetical protein
VLAGDADGNPSSPGPGQTTQEDDLLTKTPANPTDQLRKFAEESKRLYREALAISASPRVVDLSIVKRPALLSTPGNRTTTTTPTASKVWQFKERLPQVQVAKRKEEIEKLRAKIEAFKQRTHQIAS